MRISEPKGRSIDPDMSSYKKNSIAPLIVTIATVVVAAAAVVILLMVMGKDKDPNEGGSSVPSEIVFSATPELYAECESAASELVSANYEVICLFVTEGLPVKKVYGSTAEPIDGAYIIESDKYTEYSQIEALVKSIYTNEAAEKILKETELSFGGVTKTLQVYADHNINGDVFLGINTQFFTDSSYTTDWSDCFIMAEPHGMTFCDVTIYLNGVAADDASAHPESVLTVTMIKTADGWRLNEFLK